VLKIAKNKTTIFSVIFFAVLLFLLSGCSPEGAGEAVKNKLKTFNDRLGEEFNGFDKEAENSTLGFLKESQDEKKEKEKTAPAELTREQKEKIDEWLEDNGLNKYGDTKGVYYPDGTPLINQETGEKMERYEYILQRYPDILNKIEK